MDAVIQRNLGDPALAQAMAANGRKIDRPVSNVRRFVVRYSVRSCEGVVTVTVGADWAASQEASRRAAGWACRNLPGMAADTLEVAEGKVVLLVGS